MSTPPMILENHPHQPSAWRSPWPWIGIGMAAIAVPVIAIIVAIAFAAQSGAKASANRKPSNEPKVQASVLLADQSILVENAGTNSWRGAVITLDPGGHSYKLRIADFDSKQSGEFRLSTFTTASGDRFPAAERVPTIVMVQAEGLESSVYRVR